MGKILDAFKAYAKWATSDFTGNYEIKAYDSTTGEGIQSHLDDFRKKTGVAVGSLETAIDENTTKLNSLYEEYSINNTEIFYCTFIRKRAYRISKEVVFNCVLKGDDWNKLSIDATNILLDPVSLGLPQPDGQIDYSGVINNTSDGKIKLTQLGLILGDLGILSITKKADTTSHAVVNFRYKIK